jgi:serine/threonine protein kinase
MHTRSLPKTYRAIIIRAGVDRPKRNSRLRWTTRVLPVGVAIASALSSLHARGLVHGDVNPPSILVDLTTGGACLTGFGLTTRLARGHHPPRPEEGIVGTLACMAPEQRPARRDSDRRVRTGGQPLLQGSVEHRDPGRRDQRLVSFPNVIVTGHQAFFTREALGTILDTTLRSISDFAAGRPLANEVAAPA